MSCMRAKLHGWNHSNLQDGVLLLAEVKRNLRVQLTNCSCTVYASTWVSEVPSLPSERSSNIDSQGGEVLISVERGWAWRVCFRNQSPISWLVAGTTGKGREPSQIEGGQIPPSHPHNQVNQSLCRCLRSPSTSFRAGFHRGLMEVGFQMRHHCVRLTPSYV